MYINVNKAAVCGRKVSD